MNIQSTKYWRHMMVFASIGLTHTVLAEETKVELKNVPEVVIKTAKMEVSGINLIEAEMEKEKGVVVYEFKGEKDGYEYELEIS